MIAADGSLDRAAMRAVAFERPQARRQLEAILHPMIRDESARQCRDAPGPYVILAVPLLIESGTYRERCDRICVVDCPEALQIARVRQRNALPEEQIRAIMAAQASRAQRLAAADDVIVIAGKGHEPYQEINGVRHPFSDVEQTRAALEAWNNAQGALS